MVTAPTPRNAHAMPLRRRTRGTDAAASSGSRPIHVLVSTELMRPKYAFPPPKRLGTTRRSAVALGRASL